MTRGIPPATALLLALAAAGCASSPGAPAAPDGAGSATTVPGPGAAASASPGPAADLPEGPLTPEAAVRLAVARNPDLAVARSRVEAALAGIEAARSGAWPRLSLDGSYLRSNAPSAYLFKSIDARSLPRGTDFNHPGTFDNLEAGAVLRWNLWDGGRTRLATSAAAASEASAREGAAGVRNALAAAVVESILDVRAAEEMLAADDASIRSVDARAAEARVRVEGGAALRSDLLSLEVRVAEAREGRLRSDLARRLALAGLRRLLALPADAPLEVAPEPFAGAGALPATLADALDEAAVRRPEAASLRNARDAALLRAEAVRRGRLPRLDGEARAWADDGNATGSLGDRNWSAGLTLSFDILDGGARSAEVFGAEAAVRELEARRRELSQGIAMEVESSWLRLEEAHARLAVTERAVVAAEESLDLVETQFRGGSAPVTRFLEAEGARTRARTTAAGARIDVERASVELARALGRLGGEAASREGGAK